MFINELYMYSLQSYFTCSNYLKNSLKKYTTVRTIRAILGGDSKTARGVRIISVFELIGNLPYTHIIFNIINNVKMKKTDN